MKTAALLALSQIKEKTRYQDQTKTLTAGQEWNREGNTLPGGKFTYRIDSPGAIGLMILSDAGYEKILLMANGEKAIFVTGDLLRSKEFKGPTPKLEPNPKTRLPLVLGHERNQTTPQIQSRCWRR